MLRDPRRHVFSPTVPLPARPPRAQGRLQAVALALVCLGLLTVGGAVSEGQAEAKTIIRVALPVPRTQGLAVQAKRFDARLRQASGGAAGFKVYWGGAAGDDAAVLRKMKTGQMDVSVFTTEVMSRFVPSATVLISPALYFNYPQIDAVRAEIEPALNDEAYGNGFKVLGWGDIGRLRVFSKERIGTPSDFTHVRPWLYTDSQVLKSFYEIIGAAGVPLGFHEVYGAMQTGMIDTYWATASLATTLQWHRTARRVSERSVGFISGGFVMRRGLWEALPSGLRGELQAMADELTTHAQRDIRIEDERIYRKLLKRGYTIDGISDREWDAWWAVGHKLRRRLVGRLYTKDLVTRAEAIALRYADSEQKRRYASR